MRLALFLLLSIGAVPAALAQDMQRYELQKTENGYVRLDTESGAMSVCSERDGQLVCRMAADDRLALEDETERLRGELQALEARVAALEKRQSVLPLPTDGDIDRTLGVMERLLRGFVGIAKDLDRETGEGGGFVPNRT